MAKTFTFTENATSEQIVVVIDKIASFKADNFAGGTTIHLVGGGKLGVAESSEFVQSVLEESEQGEAR